MEPVAAVSTPNARRVEKRAGRFGLWLSFLPLLVPHTWIGVGLIVAALGQCLFPFVAVPIDAHVVSKSIGSYKGNATYTVNVAYASDGGKARSLAIGSDRGGYDAAKLGDVVKVRAATIAGVHHGKRADESDFPFLIFAMLFWNGILSVFLYKLTLVPLLRWWLVRRAVRADGVVDDVKVTTGKGAQARVSYHFTIPGTVDRVNAVMAVLPKHYETSGAQPSTRVSVYFHPRYPRFSVVEELSSWRVVQ